MGPCTRDEDEVQVAITNVTWECDIRRPGHLRGNPSNHCIPVHDVGISMGPAIGQTTKGRRNRVTDVIDREK